MTLPLHRRIVPPVYLLCALLLMYALHRLLPVAYPFPAPFNWTGMLPVAAGILLAATGARTFRSAGTPVKPFETSTSLVTHGLYRYTRNPMYLGLLCIAAGVWVLLGSLTPGIVLPAFFLLLRQGFVVHEERFMEGLFGDDYRRYCAQVRRWW